MIYAVETASLNNISRKSWTMRDSWCRNKILTSLHPAICCDSHG